MKKVILFALCLIIICLNVSMSQSKTKGKPVKKGVVKNKKGNSKLKATTKAGGVNLSLTAVKDDGTYSYDIEKGDELVYHVTNPNGKEYDFVITVNKFDYNAGIDFNYQILTAAGIKGHVNISPAAYHSSRKYVNYFSGGEMKLSDACAIWLCYDAFYDDIPKRKTIMTMDGNEPEVFYRPEYDEERPVIKFKGEEMKLDAFKLSNKEDGTGDKELWIHNSSGNPLILRMNLGFTIELREVR